MKKNNLNSLCYSNYRLSSEALYPIVAPLPDDLQFGLSNRCNFNCVFCGEHRPGNKPNPRQFSGDMFKMMRSILPNIKEAAFHENSEFFIDPHFSEILKICSDSDVTLSLNTNGSWLSERQIRLIENYKGHINIAISLDAAYSTTYRKLRGFDFNKVIANSQKIVNIISNKEKYKKRVWCPTHTTAAFIIMKENKNEAVEFLKMVNEMGFDRVSYYRLHDTGDWTCSRNGFVFDYQAQGSWNFKEEYNELIKELKRLAEQYGILAWLPELYPLDDVQGEKIKYLQTSHKKEDLPIPGVEPLCTKPWTGRAVINADGGVHPCCHNWDFIGHIQDGSFQTAWNSPKARAFRSALLKHRFPRTCRNGSCPVYRTWLLRKS